MPEAKKKTVRINSTIDSKIESEFRDAVYRSMGYRKGNIQAALEEAIKAWITKKNKAR